MKMITPRRVRVPAERAATGRQNQIRHLLASTILLLGTQALPASANDLPAFDEVRRSFRTSEAQLLDRHGAVLHRLRTDASVRRGTWISLDAMSAPLREALILSEDQRFHEHSGIDWQAVPAAAWSNLWNTRTRGASTLTMQLASLLNPDLAPEPGKHRSVTQKLKQAHAATRLEKHWKKHEILEAYLNLVPFRGDLVGIDALARSHFGKAPHGLDRTEAALAAVLVRAPNARIHRVAERACALLKAMGEAANCTDVGMTAEFRLAHRSWAAGEGIAPHLAHRLLKALPGTTTASVRTTLDASLQRLALQSLQRHLRELQERHVEDGAVIVLDNASGEILAWVGSSGEISQAGEVDGVTALRQPGSALKPFLYAQAIDERRMTAASLLHDAPTQLGTEAGLYMPQNHDRNFRGWVSVRTALASSLNIPAVQTLQMLTPESFQQQLQKLGFRFPEGSGYYGYSLALGSAEVSLLQLSNAYRTLANGGWHCPPSPLTEAAAPSTRKQDDGQEHCHRALSAESAWIIGNILSDRHARIPAFGLDPVLNTRFWTAVKTGTSKDMRDNWAVGWSSRYTVGVWVGNASGAPMHDVSGVTGAAPIWAEVMRELHRHVPSLPPETPSALEKRPIRFGNDREAGRTEWFMPGTAQDMFSVAGDDYEQERHTPQQAEHTPAQAGRAGSPKIATPTNGTIIALDPDIPPAHQRLRLGIGNTGFPVSATQAAKLHWHVNGQRVGEGPETLWFPLPGRHRIELRTTDGRTLDQMTVEVRGALWKSPASADGTDAR
ncbi:MAG: penicillin-binding protein 1C [Lautropia sp.]|nr:penicillin-binding protein 1C [Lautropia sp.]